MLQSELYQKIFNESGNPSVARMDEMIARYPWFAAAHYFRLYADGRMDTPSARKAALFFNNPLLLQLRLNQPDLSYQAPELPEPIAVPHTDSQPTVPDMEEVPEVIEQDLVPSSDEQTIEPATETPAIEAVAPAPATPEPATAPAEKDLMFEPLHTTDYFASQGIKLSEEAKTNDKLGKQLKSFTEWLKTMKKLPPAAASSSEDIPVDTRVAEIAENSNKELEIYTESLADVYLSQGKISKAHEIYRKLILLNPDKSAYFAAKIDQSKV
jgi:tetratricopeptide (TPR) repeat protein